jgi:hypothetical protein
MIARIGKDVKIDLILTGHVFGELSRNSSGAGRAIYIPKVDVGKDVHAFVARDLCTNFGINERRGVGATPPRANPPVLRP